MESVELHASQPANGYGSVKKFKIEDITCNTFKDGLRRIGITNKMNFS